MHKQKQKQSQAKSQPTWAEQSTGRDSEVGCCVARVYIVPVLITGWVSGEKVIGQPGRETGSSDKRERDRRQTGADKKHVGGGWKAETLAELTNKNEHVVTARVYCWINYACDMNPPQNVKLEIVDVMCFRESMCLVLVV